MPTRTRNRPQWRVPAVLMVFSLIPVLGGTARVSQLSAGGPVTEDNARFFATPAPVVVHIVGATVYCLLGALQFVPSLRRRRWHRNAGRIIVPCGLAAALSGLWMTLFYPLPASDGDLLTAFRLGFGSAMVLAIVLGVAAIRRRDVVAHRSWMIRGYAIGVGADTQSVLLGLWLVLAGTTGELAKALLMGAGWAINLAVAELIIRATPATRPAPAFGHAR